MDVELIGAIHRDKNCLRMKLFCNNIERRSLNVIRVFVSGFQSLQQKGLEKDGHNQNACGDGTEITSNSHA